MLLYVETVLSFSLLYSCVYRFTVKLWKVDFHIVYSLSRFSDVASQYSNNAGYGEMLIDRAS